MNEQEALANYCRAMICRVRNKQQPLQSSEESRRRLRAARRSDCTESERRAAAGAGFTESNLPLLDCTKRNREQTSLNLCQGPQVQPVPPQLIAMLRLKTFKEDMRRAAEVELHDPAVCTVCEQEQASLALKTFIRRKKTLLQFQTLQGRLNTHLRLDSFWEVGAKSPKALRCPSLDLGGTTW